MGFDDPQMLTPYIQMRADSIKNGSPRCRCFR